MRKKLNRLDMVANQMMKGVSGSRLPCNRAATADVEEQFRQRHEELIKELMEYIPTKWSAAVAAAIGNGMLWHGREKILPFCRALSKAEFSGADDPAHILWLWLIKNEHHRQPVKDTYKRAVCAIKAFVKGRTLTVKTLRPATSDFFEWDETYTKMCKIKGKNQYSKDDDDEIVIAKEVDEALASLEQ